MDKLLGIDSLDTNLDDKIKKVFIGLVKDINAALSSILELLHDDEYAIKGIIKQTLLLFKENKFTVKSGKVSNVKKLKYEPETLPSNNNYGYKKEKSNFAEPKTNLEATLKAKYQFDDRIDQRQGLLNGNVASIKPLGILKSMQNGEKQKISAKDKFHPINNGSININGLGQHYDDFDDIKVDNPEDMKMGLIGMQGVEEETTIKIPKNKKGAIDDKEVGLDALSNKMNLLEAPSTYEIDEFKHVNEEDQEVLKKIKTELNEDLATIDNMEDWKMIEDVEGLAKDNTKILGPDDKMQTFENQDKNKRGKKPCRCNKCKGIPEDPDKIDKKEFLKVAEQEGVYSEQQCPTCYKEFSSYSNMLIHFKAVHNKIKKFNCDFCDLTFSQKVHVKKHVQRKHPTEMIDDGTYV